MKVILNQDVADLGELGDIKVVANGYARNYLLPKNFAVQATTKAIAAFEKRKAEIDAHKEQKRNASKSFKDQLEAIELTILVPAGENGKLYGAVTNVTIVDELVKKGITVDRKKVEIHEHAIKSAGKYTVSIKLYEKEEAQIKVVVQGHVTKKESEHQGRRPSKQAEVKTQEDGSTEQATEQTAQAADVSEASAKEE
jgi:large subunit ribosomal protein L9